jgi:hypothetical protein
LFFLRRSSNTFRRAWRVIIFLLHYLPHLIHRHYLLDSISSSEKSLQLLSLSKHFLQDFAILPYYHRFTFSPTEVSELMQTKKLFCIGLDAMRGARLGELQTSHVSISLQNTFKQHL